jgi:hypothetical protein
MIPANILSAYNHSGVVITASTGEHGMFDWDGLTSVALRPTRQQSRRR